MGLRDTIQSLVNNAVTNSLSDLPSTIIFRSVTSSGYNVTTGAVSATTVTYTCTGVLTALKQDDVLDMTLIATGRKALVPALQLVGVNVDALDDEVSVDGVLYNIKQAKLDPAGALYLFVLVARQGVSLRAD